MKRDERHHLKENEFARLVAQTGEAVRAHSRGVEKRISEAKEKAGG